METSWGTRREGIHAKKFYDDNAFDTEKFFE